MDINKTVETVNEKVKQAIWLLESGDVTSALAILKSVEQKANHPKFSFVMIVLNGMPFVEFALKSIYDFAHEIIIVEGAVEKCAFAANPDGSSTDGTVSYLQNFADPHKKMKLIQGQWPEKCEMQNEALKHVSGDYVWLIDSDEVYHRSSLEAVREMVVQDPLIDQIDFIPDNFWKGFDFIFVSNEFAKPASHYRRVFKFSPGDRFSTHRPPTLVQAKTGKPSSLGKVVSGTTTRQMGIIPSHYSYVYESQVRQKIELYNRYGWGNQWGIDLGVWKSEIFDKWTPDSRTQVEMKWGPWTGDQRSRTQFYDKEHPEVIRDFIAQFKKEREGKKVLLNSPMARQVISSPRLKAEVLKVWNGIELDAPLEQRRKVIQRDLSLNKGFWNIHMGLAYTAERMAPSKILEVGTRTGGSLCQLLHHGKPDVSLSVDLWEGQYSNLPNTKQFAEQQISQFIRNYGVKTNVQMVQANSHVALPELIRSGLSFEMINVDGDHSEEGAWKDLVHAEKLLTSRGVIVFDDIIHPSFPFLLDLAYKFIETYPEFQLILNTEDDNGCAILLRGISIDEFLTPKLQEAPVTHSKKGQPLLAADLAKEIGGDLTKIGNGFQQKIKEVILNNPMQAIIETGTYLGTGSTKVIAEALVQSGKEHTKFWSIEVNPKNHLQAKMNLQNLGLSERVELLNGLSVPSHLVPNREEIQRATIDNQDLDGVYVDHSEQERVEKYFEETNFTSVQDGLLEDCLRKCDYKPSFILLDSGGHMGFVEFQYLLEKLQGECIIALDDIKHVKHHRSFKYMEQDDRFEFLFVSSEKFGACVAKYSPQPKGVMSHAPRNVLTFT